MIVTIGRHLVRLDEEDAHILRAHAWEVRVKARGSYVRRSRSPHTYLHRLILGLEKGDIRQVDHIDHDGCNNTRANLRLVTPSQNTRNTRAQVGTNGVLKGVSWHKKSRKWQALIQPQGARKHLGYFDTREAAGMAYDKAALIVFGAEYAYINYPGPRTV